MNYKEERRCMFMDNMNDLEKKYIELLLRKCIYPKQKSLFISYEKNNIDFIKKLIKTAKVYGFKDILLEEKDIALEHQLLNQLTIDEIKTHPYFYNQTWNNALEKKCAFLLVSTTFPNYFCDIDHKKIIAANQAKSKTQKKYIESVMNDSISWTIFGLPNKLWAEKLFPNDSNAYKKLEKLIYSFCMLESNNPIDKWNQYIDIENKKTNFLNQLNIKQIILQNNLGTNLKIGLANNYIFRSLEKEHCIENIPTYSIWTTPHKYIAEGIVYGSTPITYSNYNIEDYWFKFSNGKIIDYDAKIGKEYLDNFFSKGDSYKRLGEIAIIDFNSPIAETQITYNNSLFDENIATHLAFGSAYQNTIKNGVNMNQNELDNAGCNICPEHMDFTVGTKDLIIIAKTYDNKEVEIFKNGNFNYALINENSPFIKSK